MSFAPGCGCKSCWLRVECMCPAISPRFPTTASGAFNLNTWHGRCKRCTVLLRCRRWRSRTGGPTVRRCAAPPPSAARPVRRDSRCCQRPPRHIIHTRTHHAHSPDRYSRRVACDASQRGAAALEQLLAEGWLSMELLDYSAIEQFDQLELVCMAELCSACVASRAGLAAATQRCERPS